VEKKAAALPRLHETLLPAQKGDVLELDELWSFHWRQKTGPSAGFGLLFAAEPAKWSLTRLGDRSEESALWLRRCLPPSYVCRASRSDLWLSC
jgi:hypothetical protein